MSQDTKRCSRCERIKFLSDFYVFTSRKDGSKSYDCYCKECRKLVNSRGYRRAQRERIDAEKAMRESIPEGYKLCPSCKKVLPLEEYYFLPSRGKHCSYCKECSRAQQRAVVKKSKARKGVFRYKDGRLYLFKGHRNGARTLYWTNDMLSVLKRYYPMTPDSEIAEMLGLSETAVYKKAKELGMKKSKEYLSSIGKRGAQASIVAMRRRSREQQQNQP